MTLTEECLVLSSVESVGSDIDLTALVTRESNERQEQMTYLDIGLTFDATMSEFGNGVSLSSKIEQSSVAEEKSGIGPQDPIVRSSS